MFTTIIACDTFELISMLGNIPTGFGLLASSVSQGLRERPVGKGWNVIRLVNLSMVSPS